MVFALYNQKTCSGFVRVTDFLSKPLDKRKSIWYTPDMEIPTNNVTGLEDSTLNEEIEVEEIYPDDEYDGQPSEYDEWQDYMGGDDNPRDWESEGFFDE